MEIRLAILSALTEIMSIENTGFTPDEAATELAMKARIEQIPDTFLVALENDRVLGYVVGPASNQRYIDDSLFDQVQPNRAGDDYQTILSLAVAPEHQHQQVASQLLTALEKVALSQGRKAVTLTCLERLIPFYEAHGYVNEGQAKSTHAGEIWYNLVKNFCQR